MVNKQSNSRCTVQDGTSPASSNTSNSPSASSDSDEWTSDRRSASQSPKAENHLNGKKVIDENGSFSHRRENSLERKKVADNLPAKYKDQTYRRKKFSDRHDKLLRRIDRDNRSQSLERVDRKESQLPRRMDRNRSRSRGRMGYNRSRSPRRIDYSRSRSPRRMDHNQYRLPRRMNHNRSRSPRRIDRDHRSRSPMRKDHDYGSGSPRRIGRDNRSRSPRSMDRALSSKQTDRNRRSRSTSRRWRNNGDSAEFLRERRGCSNERKYDSSSEHRSPMSRNERQRRSKSKSPLPHSLMRSDQMIKEEEGENENAISLLKTSREDAMWAERRKDRDRRCECGVRSVWSRSPLISEIHEIYEEYEKLEGDDKQLEFTGPVEAIKSDESKKGEKKLRKKERTKGKKDKKHKKKRKKTASSESEEQWVELTTEMREAEAAREKMEEAKVIGPAVPEQLLQKQASLLDNTKRVNYGKDMLRGEAAAMASYIAQGKRIPRRGEIGLSSAEISVFERIGYVMSGTRHKSMEATRLRKENQVMTAEEKRLLSGFTHDERKKKEEIVLQQFKSFIESKKGKG